MNDSTYILSFSFVSPQGYGFDNPCSYHEYYVTNRLHQLACMGLRTICNQRLYIPSEISWLPKSLGLSKNSNVWSKAWVVLERNQLTTQDFEMLVIANK